MLNIPADIEIRVQCTDKNGNTGSYMFDRLTNTQFGDTYCDCVALFNSHDYAFAKAHGMINQ